MNQHKLQVIENGVDVEKYAGCAAPKLTPTLMYFGRWSSNKGLLPALALFAELHHAHPEWRLIIAGREYDLSLADLQETSSKLGISNAVTLAANPSDSEIKMLLRQASYFLCLSRHEGFGIAPIEAMSAGLTPILSAIPPFQRLIDESGLGVCFDPAMQGTEAINQLLHLQDQGETAYQTRVRAAQEFALRYAWPQVADRYLALYDQLGSAS
jgi:alpha-1,3-mannosyltransferase